VHADAALMLIHAALKDNRSRFFGQDPSLMSREADEERRAELNMRELAPVSVRVALQLQASKHNRRKQTQAMTQGEPAALGRVFVCNCVTAGIGLEHQASEA